MAKQQLVKIKVIKGTVCGGEIVKPNPKAQKIEDKFPVVDALTEDARLLMLTGFAEPASKEAADLIAPPKR